MDDMDFVDQMVADAGNTADKGGQSDAVDNAVKVVKAKNHAPDPADHQADNADNRRETFDDTEYTDEEEGGEEFDHTKIDEARKAKWPKKYANAMSRRDKENVRLRSENLAFQQRLAALEASAPKGGQRAPENANQNQNTQFQAKSAEMQKLEFEKPKLDDYEGKSFTEYQEDLIEWKAKERDLRAQEAQAAQATTQPAQEQVTPQQAAAAAENEARINKQAQELVKTNPEVLEAMQENADLIDSLPKHIVDVIGALQHPVQAMFELAQHPGAIAALGHLTPAQAAQVLANAQVKGLARFSGQSQEAGGDDQPEGDAQPAKKVSGAPAPLSASRGSPSGKKALHQMNADELDKELGLSNM